MKNFYYNMTLIGVASGDHIHIKISPKGYGKVYAIERANKRLMNLKKTRRKVFK